MLTRRIVLVSTLTGAALMVGARLAPPARAQSPDQATAFVKQAADRLLGVINEDGSPSRKYQQMREIIDNVVDVNGVARFCLGRYWRAASPQQQQEYLTLFRKVLVGNITSKLGAYQGVTYTIGRPQPQDGGLAVPTVLQRPGQPPTNVSWVVQTIDGSPKIVDVIAEGTSMRITQRADYASYIERNGNTVAVLLQALHRQASQDANG